MKTKQVLTLMAALICSTLAMFAEGVDVIIKTNSEKIEAHIQEVSSTELRYKKAENPNGPVFVISLDEVSAILYANGEVQSIEHKAAKSPIASGNLEYMGHNQYKINGTVYNGRELKFYLQQTCPAAHRYYKIYEAAEYTGYSFLATGTVMLAAGIIYSYTVKNSNWRTGTAIMCSIGGVLMATSVPLIACGNVYKKRVDEYYNMRCTNRTAYQYDLNLIAGENGLGLALRF